MRSSRVGVAPLILCLTVVGSTAWARDVYFNGVKLESNVVLRNQTFPACEVRFDASGNVYITAKGYKVALSSSGNEAPSTAAPAADEPPAKVTKRYWLIGTQTKRGLVQYDIDVFVNGSFVKRVRSGDDKTVLDVTRHIRPGINAVKVIATKNLGNRRASSSPQDVMEVVVGEGVVGAGTITIDRPVVTYRRSAAEMGNFSDTYSFQSR